MTIPVKAESFGKPPKTTQAAKVANGISRYWIGASVVDGAKRSDHVINKCAIVAKAPKAINNHHWVCVGGVH